MIKKNKLLITLFILTLWSCSQNEQQEQINKSLTNNFNKEIQVCIDQPLLNNNSTINKRGTLLTSSKWSNGAIIRIKFLNGDNNLQNNVKLYANIWTEFANLKFQFVSVTENADVKIAFKWNGDTSSNSFLGTQCKNRTQNEPSMNFGFDSTTTEIEQKATILHEFGHLLGLVHEHQNPTGNILWNKPAAYEYYKKYGFTKQMVDDFIISKYSENQTNFTAYDNQSIMIYAINPSLTTNGYSVEQPKYLSNTDKLFIRKMYPFPIKSNMYPSERIDENNRITSPNGRYYLTIQRGVESKLIIYDDIESKILWSRVPNIKFNNFSSRNIFCELREGELLLFQGSVSRLMTGDNSLGYVNYATLTDNGDIELIKNNIPVWSLFKGKLN